VVLRRLPADAMEICALGTCPTTQSRLPPIPARHSVARMMRTFLLVILLCLPAPQLRAQSVEVDALARSVLTGLQAQSIRGNREFCGLIWRDRAGRLVAGEPVRGRRARCRYPDAPRDAMEIYTYHTHGAFLKQFDNEVPSVLDVLAEMQTQTIGYVSTPGGRLWVVDGRAGTARLICGPKCLPWDPRFIPGFAGPIAGFYSLSDLKRRYGNW
jgi:hypothetical protein